jgi:hypothetical protein
MSRDDRAFQHRLLRIQVLVEALEACPDPAVREGARELVRALLDLHAAGLARILDLAGQPGESGRGLTTRLAGDDLVGSLLLMHGLHPVPVAERVAQALERARPRLRAGAADVELLQATEERIRVRLRGDLSAGPGLRAAVEAVLLEAAPDVAAVEFEEAWDRPPSGRVPLPLLG